MRRAACLAAATLFLGVAPRADAHAFLLRSTPAVGSAVERSPQRVVLVFSEPVAVVAGTEVVGAGRTGEVRTGEARVASVVLALALVAAAAGAGILIALEPGGLATGYARRMLAGGLVAAAGAVAAALVSRRARASAGGAATSVISRRAL